VSARSSYGARVPGPVPGGVVAAVDPGGPAARAGLVSGDIVLRAGGRRLRDVIDWRWETDGASVEAVVRDARGDERRVALSREPGEPWGLAFSEAVFDGVRTCRNRCAFCFMTQLPKGLRRALYVRDDDFRLSFLQGNFITLTNLSDADVARIVEQRLSPLYVSVHAVDAAVRTQLVCAEEDRALERFDELLGQGIEFHTQVVLVPGVNDGEVLQDSLRWLAERVGVLSVGVVPLGFTAHQHRFEASFAAPGAAAGVIGDVEPWQAAFRERDGLTWVYVADEFYLNAGLTLPPAAFYDDFPQFENGIGLARSFIDEATLIAPQLAEATALLPDGVRVALPTGELFAPVLERIVADVDPKARLAVLGVPNEFFGGNVSVAGLLSASDLVPAIAAESEATVYLVPGVVANADGLLLDDVPASVLGERTGKDVRLVSCDAGGLLAGLRDIAENPPHAKE